MEDVPEEPHLARDDDPVLRRAREILAAAREVLVLTGAGISADSGVPTFRGPDGLWKRHRPEELATPEAFARDPRLVWEWYGWRRELVARCAPNAAHLALARWAVRREGVRIVTQNVDGLHAAAAEEAVRELAALGQVAPVGKAAPADVETREAGRTAAEPDGGALARALPLELHGSLYRVRCTACGERCGHREPIDASSADALPRCRACGALLRPDVVWFGESLPPDDISEAFRLAAGADACLVVGTSAVVHPAAGLATTVHGAGGTLLEVNPEETPITPLAAVSLRAGAAEAVPEMVPG